MSFDALHWAAKQRPGNLAAKMVLLALANWASEDGCAYPSTAAIAEFGDMDHKTATAALDRLLSLRLISDTGERQGRTKQIKVYQLALPGAVLTDVVPGQVAYTYVVTDPATGDFYIGMRCCAGDPTRDRYFGSGLWPKLMAAEGRALNKSILNVFDSPNECRAEERRLIEEAAGNPRCRNVEFNMSGKGRVKTGALKPSVSSVKDPQKRGTDTVKDTTSEAKASSVGVRATRIPNDWVPRRPYPEAVTALIVLWPPGREDREVDGFRDYWTSRSRDAARTDWDKTWHNRIRDQHDRIMREARYGQRPANDRPDEIQNVRLRAAVKLDAERSGGQRYTGF